MPFFLVFPDDAYIVPARGIESKFLGAEFAVTAIKVVFPRLARETRMARGYD